MDSKALHYRNPNNFADIDSVSESTSSENNKSEEMMISEPNPIPSMPQTVPINLMEDSQRANLDDVFEIAGETMIFCGIPLVIHSGKYTIGNKQIVYQIPDFQNSNQPISFAIDLLYVDRVLIPPQPENNGAFFMYFQLSEVGMFMVYDVLKKYFPFLPLEIPKLCNHRSKFILTDAFYNWNADREEIFQLLQYLDCAIVFCGQKEKELYVYPRLMRVNSNIAFVRTNDLIEILGLAKCKILIESSSGKSRAIIERDQYLVNFVHEIRYQFEENTDDQANSNNEIIPYDLTENVELLKQKKIFVEKNDFSFSIRIDRLIRLSKTGWISDCEIHDMIKLHMECILTDKKQKRRFGLISSEVATECFMKNMEKPVDRLVQLFEFDLLEMGALIDSKNIGSDEISEFYFYRQDYVFLPVVYLSHHILMVIVNPNGAACTIHDYPNFPKNVINAKIMIFDSKRSATPFVDTHAKLFALARIFLEVTYYRNNVIAPGVFQRDKIEEISVTVPQQNNDFDCGFYVLKIVEKFLKNPPEILNFPTDWTSISPLFFHDVNFFSGREDYFNQIWKNCKNKRKEIQAFELVRCASRKEKNNDVQMEAIQRNIGGISLGGKHGLQFSNQ